MGGGGGVVWFLSQAFFFFLFFFFSFKKLGVWCRERERERERERCVYMYVWMDGWMDQRKGDGRMRVGSVLGIGVRSVSLRQVSRFFSFLFFFLLSPRGFLGHEMAIEWQGGTCLSPWAYPDLVRVIVQPRSSCESPIDWQDRFRLGSACLSG